MTDTNTLVIAVMSALALLVSVIALRRTKKDTRAGSDEPITMSGGSLHYISPNREWDFTDANQPVSLCATDCKRVWIYVDGDVKEQIHGAGTNQGFTITFNYERSEGHATGPNSKKYSLILTHSVSISGNAPRFTIQITGGSAANPRYSAEILKLFLLRGSHPHTHGKLKSISSTGLNPAMTYTASGNSGLDEIILITDHSS